VPVAVIAIALAVDLVLGDPPNRFHPVAWLGTVIAMLRHRLARGPAVRLLITGAAVTLGVSAVSALAGALVARLAAHAGLAGILIEGAVLSGVQAANTIRGRPLLDGVLGSWSVA